MIQKIIEKFFFLKEIKIAVFAGGNARSYQFVIVHLMHVGGHLLVKYRLSSVKMAKCNFMM